MPNYEYKCGTCDSVTIEFHKMADKPESITCACGGLSKFRIAAVPLMQASYPDGVRKFTDMREAAKLNREAAVSTNDRKKEIAGEIRKMGVRVGKPIV